VHLTGAVRDKVLTVPSEALIRTGTRSLVIVAEDGGHFRPALVQVGAEQGGKAEIVEGLSAGQQVAASGQFLIDSEANLRRALDGLAAPQPDDAAKMQMPMPGQGH